MSEPRTRRERLRQELTADIKVTALRLLAEGGPQAVTLRGIARELGVSPAALYGYFDSLDDLFTVLIADGFNDQADAIEQAITDRADRPVEDRLHAALLAYRAWALAHPGRFRLLYHSPIPGYTAPSDGPTIDANLRTAVPFLVLLLEAWDQGAIPPPPSGPSVDAAKFRERFGLAITSDQLRWAMSCWGQFHGLVSLEVNGHITPEWSDPAAVYEAAMREMARRTGFPEPAPDVNVHTVVARDRDPDAMPLDPAAATREREASVAGAATGTGDPGDAVSPG